MSFRIVVSVCCHPPSQRPPLARKGFKRRFHPTQPHTPNSAFVKCGFAGESAPRCILPSPLDGWLAQARPADGANGWGVAEWEAVLGPYLVRLYLHHLRCRPKVIDT